MSNEPMTAAQHTPGPWTYWLEKATDSFGASVCALKVQTTTKNQSLIALIDLGWPQPADGGYHVNNAHLIAAAPELLAACRTLADYYKGHEATDDQAAKEAGGGVYRALVEARAAIAKADGKGGGR